MIFLHGVEGFGKAKTRILGRSQGNLRVLKVGRLLDINQAHRIFLAVGHLGVSFLVFFFCLKANFGTVSDSKFAAACLLAAI